VNLEFEAAFERVAASGDRPDRGVSHGYTTGAYDSRVAFIEILRRVRAKADWVTTLIDEAATFPNGKHDDQVDAYSQAINWARTNAYGPAMVLVAKGHLPDPANGHQPLSVRSHRYARHRWPRTSNSSAPVKHSQARPDRIARPNPGHVHARCTASHRWDSGSLATRAVHS
jgi:hypothetical protein